MFPRFDRRRDSAYREVAEATVLWDIFFRTKLDVTELVDNEDQEEEPDRLSTDEEPCEVEGDSLSPCDEGVESRSRVPDCPTGDSPQERHGDEHDDRIECKLGLPDPEGDLPHRLGAGYPRELVLCQGHRHGFTMAFAR